MRASTFDTASDPESILASIWRNAWTPPDRRAPWQWCEDHIKSIPYSPIPGGYRSDNSPWMREPMEAVVNPAIPCVFIMAAIQSGKTTVVELASAYIIANLPGPMLWLDQTDPDARDQNESRLQKLYAECPPVKRLFHSNKNKTKLEAIHFAHGMTMHVLGAHNPKNLQRRSVRWLIGDETWKWPQGHMAEAEARTTAFGWLGKRVFVSQGGFEGDDTDKKWKSGDRREWTFCCVNPECKHRQQFQWKQVEWPKEAHDGTAWDYAQVSANTVYLCEECGHVHTDSQKTRVAMNRTGRYVATNPKASGKVVSFHWNALCASSWGMLAELYLAAKESAKRGDIADLRIWWQKRMAVSWTEELEDYSADLSAAEYVQGDAWEQEGALTRNAKILAAPFDPALAAVPLRVMTVDCQIDHYWVLVRSWSANGNSRMVKWGRCNNWEEVEAFQKAHGVHGALVFIDARHQPYNVYKKCAEHGWTALMGDKRQYFPHKVKVPNNPGARRIVNRFYSKRDPIAIGDKECGRHLWSNLSVKDMLSRLMRNTDGSRGVTWEFPADAGDDYLRQLDSERRVVKAGVPVWEQIGKRDNHIWDCESMQIVAALMLKIIGRESLKAMVEREEALPPGESAAA